VTVPRYAPASGYATTVNYAEVRSAVTGKLKEIRVNSGESVEKGDVLLVLEDDAERAAVAEMSGLVNKGEAELAHAIAAAADRARQHTNHIKVVQMEVEYSRECVETTRKLHQEGIASVRQLADDMHSLAKCEEELRALNEIDLTVDQLHIEVLRKELEMRRETLARAQAALEQRTVRAPVDGRVVRYTFYVGEILLPDKVLYEIFEGEVDMLKLRIPERYATRVEQGMELRAYLGTYRTLVPTRFYGKVEYLRDIVEGDGTKNYRMAYCSFDRGQYAVTPGTSVDADIRTGQTSLWMYLLQP